LNEHNTVFARSGPLYATCVSLGPLESSSQTTSRSLQLFLQGSLGDRPTDRPTDHAIRPVTIGGAHSGEAKCFPRPTRIVDANGIWIASAVWVNPILTRGDASLRANNSQL